MEVWWGIGHGDHYQRHFEVEQEGEQRQHVDNWYLEGEEDKTELDRIRIIGVEVGQLGGKKKAEEEV